MTFWVAGAVVVGGIGSALISSDAAGSAADTQAAATGQGLAEQRRQFDLTRSDFAPYRAAGTQALGQLQTDINAPVTSSDVMSDPGYAFGLQQGQQALDRKTAAMGGRVSGAALKRASEYATNYATTGYNAAYQRRQDRLNRLAALAGVGQTATNSSAVAGGQSAGAITGLLTSQGDATAASQLARGNIWGGAANQLGSVGQRWANQPSSGYVPNGSYDPNGYGIDPNGYLGGSNTAGDYSDARLKTDVRRIGTTAKGNAWYSWRWKTGGTGEGVIAQEVAHVPGAVHADAAGLLMVDYSRV